MPDPGGISNQAVWGFLPDPVLKIENKKYSKKDFLEFAASRLDPRQIQTMNEDNAKQLTPKLITDMIEFELLMKCVEKSGITPSPKLVVDDMDKEFNAMSEADQKKLSEQLFNSMRLNFEAYKKKLSEDKSKQEQAAIGLWVDKFIKPNIKITDADIKKFYDESADLIKASHILIKPETFSKEAKDLARKKAEIVLAKLKKGEKFEDLAKESSCENSDLGEFGHGQMVQEFEDAAFKLKPGEYSDVVESPFGYHVIKVHSRRKQELPPLDEVKSKIKEQLEQMKLQDLMIAKVLTEKEQCKIENFYQQKMK